MRVPPKPAAVVGAVAAVLLVPIALPAGTAAAAAQQQAASAANHSTVEVLPAYQMLNRPLQDPQGHDAGRIDGVILNTENGAVDFVIIAGRGNFDLNGNVIAVPWSQLAPPMAGQGPITIKLSAAKLAQAPRLNPNMIGALEQPRTRGDVYGDWAYPYWGRRGYWGYPYWGYYGPWNWPYGWGPGYAYRSVGPAQARAQQRAEPQLTANGLFVSANGVIATLKSIATTPANAMRSAPVYASNLADGGENIGNIKGVMIDPQRGEVAFVLIERGGFLGLQPRWYAVPPEALAWAPYQGGYDLTVNEQLLNTAPRLEHTNNNGSNGPVAVPANQLAQLYRHFGITPYWEQGTAQSQPNPSNTAGVAGASSGSSQPPANPK